MKSCKRPLMNQGRDFYETPTDASGEEIQRGCQFVKRLKTMEDMSIFDQHVDAMKSYQSGSISYIDLKNRLVYILGNQDGLVEEFHQLFTDLASLGRRNSIKESAKPDLERPVQFSNKFEALGWRQVTPSYYIRPGVEEGSSSSSDGVLNDKYVSVGDFDPDKVVKRKRRLPLHYLRMNDLEETLYEEDMLLEPLASVIEFGNDGLREKPPARFYEVIQRYYGSKTMPQMFKIDPKLAVQGILDKLVSMEKEMRRKVKISRQKINNGRVVRKNFVNK